MTTHNVQRLLSSLRNTPLLTTPENLREIEDYLISRNASEDLAVLSHAEARQDAREVPPTVENGVGFLEIEGALTYKHSWINSLCGIISYQKLVADFEALIEQGAHTIALDISSPGGMAHGCFEAAMGMRDMADKAGVRIIAYVDMQACSAAYAIACVADELIVNPLAKVGSIGVVLSLVNDLPKRIEEGTEVVFVYAGDSKIPYDEDGKFRKDFIADLQKDTDALYQDFIKHVAEFRPMTPGAIRDTGAKTYRSSEAMTMGLADREMTSQEFINHLAHLADEYDHKMNQQDGDSKMPLFGWPKKNKPEMSEKESQASLEATLEESPTQEELSSQQPNETTNEANMTFEEMMASPEAQAKLEEMAAAKAEAVSSELKAKLAQFESASVESAKLQYKELVAGYSFVGAEAQEKVAAFLYHANAEKMEGVEHVMEALESARNAVEAVVDEELGDSGEALEVDEDVKSKSAVSDLIKNRYNK